MARPPSRGPGWGGAGRGRGGGGGGGGPGVGGEAPAPRASLDRRATLLKSDRDKATASLSHLYPQPSRWSPWGLRIALLSDSKNPAVHAEPAFLKGLVEVQDEGSQLAALLAA